METKDVKKLARLAHIEIEDAEIESLKGDLEAVLGYVKTLESVEVDVSEYQPRVVNVLREDEDPLEPETFTKRMLAEAPETENGYIKVQKIL